MAQGTGLPYTDGFETDLTGWPGSNTTITIESNKANSGSSSAEGDALSDAEDSGFLNRAWGDARVICNVTPSCYNCNETTECPGGHTPDIDITYWVFTDPTDYAPATSGGADRKHIQVLIFERFGASHGTNLSHSISYISILNFDGDDDGEQDEVVFNHFRRHDNAGDPISDVITGSLDNDDPSHTMDHDAWNKVRVRMKVNTPGQSDGILQIWLNDVIIDNYDGTFNHHGGYDGGQTYNMMIISDNGDGPDSPATVTTFWDDVVIAETSSGIPTLSGATITGGILQ